VEVAAAGLAAVVSVVEAAVGAAAPALDKARDQQRSILAMRSGRLMGILLIGGGLALAIIGVLWLVTSVSGGRLQVTGAVLGGGFLAIVVLPLIGAGIFLLVRSGREAAEDAQRMELRRILDEVKSRGQVPISDLVLELGSSRDQVQKEIHSLVGMGLFAGFINWDEGVLYSQDASALRELDKCKNCGGELKLVGKGVVTCPYCGTEYFLN
jgi:hypothetical protein